MANSEAKPKAKSLPVSLRVISNSRNSASLHDVNSQILTPVKSFHNVEYYFELIRFTFWRILRFSVTQNKEFVTRGLLVQIRESRNRNSDLPRQATLSHSGVFSH
jgi:hypothetical protein